MGVGYVRAAGGVSARGVQQRGAADRGTADRLHGERAERRAHAGAVAAGAEFDRGGSADRGGGVARGRGGRRRAARAVVQSGGGEREWARAGALWRRGWVAAELRPRDGPRAVAL